MLFKIEAVPCRTIKDIERLDSLYKEGESGDRIENAKGVPYVALWNQKNDIEKPGVDQDGVLAIAFLTYYKRGLPINNRKWIKFNQNFFDGLCRKENILSILYKKSETEPFCVTFVFPQQGRVLSVAPWYKSGAINKKIVANYYKAIEEQVGIFRDEEDEKEKEALKERRKSYPLLNRIDSYQSKKREENDDIELFYDSLTKEKCIQTDMDYDSLKRIEVATVSYFTEGVEKQLFNSAQRGEISEADFLEHVERYLNKNWKTVTHNDRQHIKEKVRSAVYGYYVLDPLIDDENISDIQVMTPDKIRVKVGGNRYTSNLNFLSMRDYRRFIEGVADRNHIDLYKRPQAIFTDKFSSDKFILRFDITTELVNSVTYPYIHARKIPKKKRTMQDLMDLDMLPKKVADYLIEKVKYSPGILFCGKGASGKTSLFSTMIDYIPFNKSGIVLQESEEIFTNVHPHIKFQHILYAEQSPTGKEIGLKELTKAALVSDEDYIMIGEIKGGEALYGLNAAATGHQFMASLHSYSSQSAIDKMTDYIMYESSYDQATAKYMLKNIEVIVFMKNFKVEEISEVVGWDHEKKDLVYKVVYSRDPEDYLEKKKLGLLE